MCVQMVRLEKYLRPTQFSREKLLFRFLLFFPVSKNWMYVNLKFFWGRIINQMSSDDFPFLVWRSSTRSKGSYDVKTLACYWGAQV